MNLLTDVSPPTKRAFLPMATAVIVSLGTLRGESAYQVLVVVFQISQSAL
jgi:hypothetical protein